MPSGVHWGLGLGMCGNSWYSCC